MSKKTFFSLLDRVQKDFSTIRGSRDKGQNGQKWAGQLANWVYNERFLRYLEFASSDFDETLRKCSWYEKNED